MKKDDSVQKFLDICKEYVKEMNEKVNYKKTDILARASNSSYMVYMDYSALRHRYTKDDAKLAMLIFKKYASKAVVVLQEMKEEHPELTWEVTKTEMSSALLGKSLNVFGTDDIFPEFSYEDDESMNVNENAKITLTIGQLKKLVKESLRDVAPLKPRSDFEEPVSDDDKAAGEAAKARGEELRAELKKFLEDNGISPFENGRDYLYVRRFNDWNDDSGKGYWGIEVFDTQINFYDNGRVKWNGGRTLSGFDLDDEGDDDEDSVASKKRFRFIQKMMNDKEFVKQFKEIVLRVGNEERELNKDIWRRDAARRKIGDDRYSAARSERAENIKKEIRSAKFALVNGHDDDGTGILYRNKPCRIIEVGDDEEALRDIMWHPWQHPEYRSALGDTRDVRLVPVRLLKGL